MLGVPTIVALLSVLLKNVFGDATPVYSIVGSDTIKEGDVFRFSAWSRNFNEPLQANFTISGTGIDDNPIIIDKPNAVLLADQLSHFEFDTSKLLNGQYQFVVNVYDPFNHRVISDQVELQFLPNEKRLVIQTDKDIYKPDDLIRFRLFGLDGDSKPVDIDGETVVHLIDPQGFALSTIDSVAFSKGHYKNEFQLSNLVSTGFWTIRVQAGDEIYDKTIDVQHFDFPLYTANVVAPKRVALSDGNFTVSVSVDYAFGKTMRGTAVVSFYRFRQLKFFERTIHLGKEVPHFVVDILNDLGIRHEETVDIELEFTDSLSDLKVTAAASTTVKEVTKSLYVNAAETFRRSSTLNFEVLARKFDGSLKTDAAIDISIVKQINCISSSTEDERNCEDHFENYECTTNQNGICEGEILTEDFSYIIIESSCSDCEPATRSAEYRDMSFDIKVLTANPTLHQQVDVSVETNLDIAAAFCYFSSRAAHLDMIQVEFTTGVAMFSFIPDGKYAPSTEILCTGMDVDRQRYTSQSLIEFKELSNTVTIEVLTSTLEPGMTASVRVTSKLNSTVSLLAIDHRLAALQLSTGGNPMQNIRHQHASTFELFRVVIDETTTTMGTPPTAPTVTQTESYSDVVNHTPVTFTGKMKKALTQKTEESDDPDVRIRRNFAETFLWEDVEIVHASENDPTLGSEIVHFAVPDSISTFAINGLAFSDDFGSGVLLNAPEIQTMQPFFIAMDLPFSIQQVETLTQTILVHNYSPFNMTGLITMRRDPDRFFLVNSARDGWSDNIVNYNQMITSTADSIIAFTFALRPRQAGVLTLHVEVAGFSREGDLIADAVQQNMLVLADGIERVVTDTTFLMKAGSSVNSTTLSCTVPENIDETTVRTSLTIVGDLLGDVLQNMERLIVLPTGCGEQSLAKFAPGVTVYGYLREYDQLTPSLVEQIRTNTIRGIQNHMVLRNATSGAFSFFPSTGGSTFVSAFTVKLFRKAQEITPVDQNLLRAALNFLQSMQNTDGSIREDTLSILLRHQGGLIGPVAITAYVAVIFTEAMEEFPAYLNNRNRAITFLANTPITENAYELAISCYALHLNNNSAFTQKYNALMRLAIEDSDFLYWNVQGRTTLNIETTAYALLFIRDVDPGRAIKLVKYLVSRKNANGGWGSSQDTVVALDALTSVAALVAVFEGDMSVNVWPSHGHSFDTNITNANRNELQSFDLDPNAREALITLRGPTTGKIISSMTCRYFEHIENYAPRFEISHRLLANCNTPLRMEVCMSYIPDRTDQFSDMVVVRMNMPSGYVFDPQTPDIRLSSRALEQENQGTRIIVYLDPLSTQTVCFNVHAIQRAIVSDEATRIIEAIVEVIDMYSPEKRAELVYGVPDDLGRC